MIKNKLGIAVLLALSSCTISMQNISTYGTANDLIDENLKADANVTAELPLNAL